PIEAHVVKVHPQLQAVARSEYLRSDTRFEGLYLQLCIDCLGTMKIEIRGGDPSPPPVE
ncbi:hypothetical protein L917_03065, partial [Phytophthora nicotianae]